jgi:hypothetical protein
MSSIRALQNNFLLGGLTDVFRRFEATIKRLLNVLTKPTRKVARSCSRARARSQPAPRAARVGYTIRRNLLCGKGVYAPTCFYFSRKVFHPGARTKFTRLPVRRSSRQKDRPRGYKLWQLAKVFGRAVKEISSRAELFGAPSKRFAHRPDLSPTPPNSLTRRRKTLATRRKT